MDVEQIHDAQRVAAAVVLHTARGDCDAARQLMKAATADDPALAIHVAHALAHWLTKFTGDQAVAFGERLVAITNRERP